MIFRIVSKSKLKSPLIIIIFKIFSEDLKLDLVGTSQLKSKPAVKDLGFGKHFTDHMLRIKWSEKNGWGTPLICQLRNFDMHPAAKVKFSFSEKATKICAILLMVLTFT